MKLKTGIMAAENRK